MLSFRACKGIHQSAASAKLNPELRLLESLKKISSIGYERQIKSCTSAFLVHDALHRTPKKTSFRT
jgi:hypothetical protein